MEERRLVLFSIIFSIIGIIAIFVVSRHIEINDTTIEKITSESLKSSVKVTGKVASSTSRGSVQVLDIIQEQHIRVVVMDSDANFTPGTMVSVEGRVDDDSDEKEIIAEEIVLVR